MGRILAELVGNEIIITRYESNGFIIPESIDQEKVLIKIINENLDRDKEDELPPSPEDRVVPRSEFILKLLGSGDDSFKTRYSQYARGLYSVNDMGKGITWCEVAYLLYYVGGLPRMLDWNSIQPKVGKKVCVLHEIRQGSKIIDERLSNYKNRLDMEVYINALKNGKRYIPMPLFCSFVDLMNRNISGFGEASMFKKLSESEFNMLFRR